MFKPKLPDIHHKEIHHHGNSFQHHDGLGTSQTYYWIVAENQDRRVIYGCKGSLPEAERFRAGIKDAFTEIIALPTRNADAARELLRGRTLSQTGSINQSFKKNQWKCEGE